MWHSAIEKDLQQIFGVTKVLFASALFGKEQDVLFCDVETSVSTIKEGKAISKVCGKISIIGRYGKSMSGFLSKRVQLADVNLTQKFVFSREESPISMGVYGVLFNVYSVNFMYFYKEQYNKTSRKINANEFDLNVILKK